MTRFKLLLLKVAVLLSYCGGPLLIGDELKLYVDQRVAFFVTFMPLALILFGALHLEDPLESRWSRVAVFTGRIGSYGLLAMDALASWTFAHGLRVREQGLYYIGIAVGVVSAVAYLHVTHARRSINVGNDWEASPPIEPR